ncbi:MAG: DUF4856 domain-containing protein [Flavobacteriales bacterium]|nr:DUF4856 domain-containing protein [Flavobacteriales bacterium]
MHNYLALAVLSVFTFSCTDDDSIPSSSFEVPEIYSFERGGSSTVDFSGQTDRLLMGKELLNSLKDVDNATLDILNNQFVNTNNPFSDSELNSSSKNIKSKVASSYDYFSTHSVESEAIKSQFETWFSNQVNNVFSNKNTVASAGNSGYLTNGTSNRYVNAKGLELNQVVAKGLIGALCIDQILNNYLSKDVLDAGSNIENNTNKVFETDKNYTTMEHYWDEAYGYIYGVSSNYTNPNSTIGSEDGLLGKYLSEVSEDNDFENLDDNVFYALKKGRAAIVANDYTARNEQIKIIKENISLIPAVRSIYYLQQGKTALNTSPINYYSAFHALSEAYGLIYSLQFTQNPATGNSYLSSAEVDSLLEDLLGDGANGLWDLEDTTLDSISEAIAIKYSFTVEQASSLE